MHASNFGSICKATHGTNKDQLARSLTTVAKTVKAAAGDQGIKYEATAVGQYEATANGQYEKMQCSQLGFTSLFSFPI